MKILLLAGILSMGRGVSFNYPKIQQNGRKSHINKNGGPARRNAGPPSRREPDNSLNY
jgi:hypothetical protein